MQRPNIELYFDNDNDDDVPRLSTEAMLALAEFYAERNATNSAVSINEDWQLSQFWYSEETAAKLAEECVAVLRKNNKIACVSCPTLVYYLLQHDFIESENITVALFEYDRRFAIKFPKEFIFYDYRQPLEIPEYYHNAFDLVVIDPPFLSDECLSKIAQTVQLLSSGSGTKLVICTGSIMTELVGRLFQAHRCNFQPSHRHNLANEFACFANYRTVFL